jgi:shikimate kinase
MGVGKTFTGRKLAGKLGVRFVDMDELIESEVGLKIPEIFSEKGEDWFREKESDILRQLSVLQEDMVISTGGGTPCFNDNIDIINSTGISVYLQLSPTALANRLNQNEKENRPLVKGKTNEELISFIEARLFEREKFYQQAKFIVSAKNLEIDELISIINY